jgi:hypothetical protein
MSLDVSEDEEAKLTSLTASVELQPRACIQFVCSPASADGVKEYFSIFVEEIMHVISMSK